MLRHCEGELGQRVGARLGGATCFLVLVWVGSSGTRLGLAEPSAAATALPLGDGVVSGVFVAGAAWAALVTWRRHAGPLTGWIVATGALVAAQALVVTLLAFWTVPAGGALGLGVLVLVAAAGLPCVVGPLVRLPAVGHVVDDGFAIGLGMGLVAAAYTTLQFPTTSVSGPRQVAIGVIGVVILTQVVATGLVLRQRLLSRPVSALLAATTVAVAVGLAVHSVGPSGTLVDAVMALTRAALGAAWLTMAAVSFRRSLEEQHRRVETIQQLMNISTRDQRERLHELRSTLAGLITGSAMMERPDVSPETRERLWCAVRRELDRMDRLLSKQDQPATDIDLDDALGMILDLQRLKGRHVEFHSNGDVVRARFDALSEVLNILMDNAVTHGHTDSSLVEVERRDEQTVDIRVTDFGCGIPEDRRARIFEWGGRGSDSPGEGIGLHLARRLMNEDGGSLRLAEDQGVGSSFVISLPAARRSSENHLDREDDRAWRHSS